MPGKADGGSDDGDEADRALQHRLRKLIARYWQDPQAPAEAPGEDAPNPFDANGTMR